MGPGAKYALHAGLFRSYRDPMAPATPRPAAPVCRANEDAAPGISRKLFSLPRMMMFGSATRYLFADPPSQSLPLLTYNGVLNNNTPRMVQAKDLKYFTHS